MERQRGKNFIVISVLVIALFWCIGLFMLLLQGMSIIHIPGWIIAIQFWGPYVAFIFAFMIILARDLFRSDKNQKQ